MQARTVFRSQLVGDIVTGNITAANRQTYIVTASAVISDPVSPTPAEGDWFMVVIAHFPAFGAVTVGGTNYPVGTQLIRTFYLGVFQTLALPILYGGVVLPASGGTGIANAGTLTIPSNTSITGGGVLALGGCTLTVSSSGTLALGGFIVTVPATGTVALLGTSNTYTGTTNTFTLPTTTGTTTTSGIAITADSLTTGTAFSLTSTSASSSGATALMKLSKTGAGAVNKALELTASGGTSNKALSITAGQLDLGAAGSSAAPAIAFTAAGATGGIWINGGLSMGGNATELLRLASDGSIIYLFQKTAVYTASGLLQLGSAQDVGIARNASGVMEVNSGTAGTLRDITLRNITASGPATFNGNVALGNATTDLVGFYGVTATAQGASVADATGGAIIDTEARAAINALISRIEALGLIATV